MSGLVLLHVLTLNGFFLASSLLSFEYATRILFRCLCIPTSYVGHVFGHLNNYIMVWSLGLVASSWFGDYLGTHISSAVGSYVAIKLGGYSPKAEYLLGISMLSPMHPGIVMLGFFTLQAVFMVSSDATPMNDGRLWLLVPPALLSWVYVSYQMDIIEIIENTSNGFFDHHEWMITQGPWVRP